MTLANPRRRVVTPKVMTRLRRVRRVLEGCDGKQASDLVCKCDQLIDGIQLGRYNTAQVKAEIQSVLTGLETVNYSGRKGGKQ